MSDEHGPPDQASARLLAYLRAGSTPVTYVDRDGVVLEVNDMGLQNLGMTREQALGRSVFGMFPSLADCFRERFARVFDTAQPVVAEDDVPLREGNQRLKSLLDPVKDDAGRVTAVRIQSWEVTAEYAVADSLRRADQKLSTIFEHSPYTIVLLTRGGIISYINRVGPGFTMEEVLGSDSHRSLDPGFHAAFDESLRRVFDEAGMTRLEFRDIHGSWWDSTLVPIMDDGRVEHGLSFSIDTTEKRRAAEADARLRVQMQDAQRLESLGVLAGGIAHDFNNLLMVIGANTELAMARQGVDEESKEYFEDVIKASERAADLCKQLLAYAGRGQFAVERVDLSGVVAEMAQLVAVSVSKGVLLRRDLARTLPAIEADPTQLRQVVLNLITNASDAIGDAQGTISISTRVEQLGERQLTAGYTGEPLEPGEYVMLTVQDTGSGTDEQTRSRMFEPFFSTKGSGRGLGLSATLGIIRRHRGAIFVESTPGQGTAMRVIFPVAVGRAKLAGPRPSSSVRPGRGLILVVDDEPGVRRVASNALTSAGYDVTVASDGGEGVARFDERSAEIRLVLLDLTMPVLDGEQTMRALRERAPMLPIVIMSGYAESAPRGDNVRFLAKPFKVDALRAIVSEMLRDAL